MRAVAGKVTKVAGSVSAVLGTSVGRIYSGLNPRLKAMKLQAPVSTDRP